jgi:hypothetical protein
LFCSDIHKDSSFYDIDVACSVPEKPTYDTSDVAMLETVVLDDTSFEHVAKKSIGRLIVAREPMIKRLESGHVVMSGRDTSHAVPT